MPGRRVETSRKIATVIELMTALEQSHEELAASANSDEERSIHEYTRTATANLIEMIKELRLDMEWQFVHDHFRLTRAREQTRMWIRACRAERAERAADAAAAEQPDVQDGQNGQVRRRSPDDGMLWSWSNGRGPLYVRDVQNEAVRIALGIRRSCNYAEPLAPGGNGGPAVPRREDNDPNHVPLGNRRRRSRSPWMAEANGYAAQEYEDPEDVPLAFRRRRGFVAEANGYVAQPMEDEDPEDDRQNVANMQPREEAPEEDEYADMPPLIDGQGRLVDAEAIRDEGFEDGRSPGDRRRGNWARRGRPLRWRRQD